MPSWTSMRSWCMWSALILTSWTFVLLASGSVSYGERHNPGKDQHEAQSKPNSLTPSPVLRPTGNGNANSKQHNTQYYVQEFLGSALSVLAHPSITDWILATSAAVYSFFAIRQWRAIRDQATITRVLVGLERPFVVLSETEPGFYPPPSVARVDYTITNTGRTTAVITEVSAEIHLGETLPTVPVYDPEKRLAGPAVLLAGKDTPEFHCEFRQLTEDEWKRLNESDNPFTAYFWGYIKYADVLGNPYIHGFCREYFRQARSARFFLHISGGEAYNYNRTG